MFIEVNDEDEMKTFGQLIGSLLSGGEIVELIGDVGAGKTTLVKGIAVGLNINDYIQSPSFTINRVYKGRDDITLAHYDFYRLDDAGVMGDELAEAINEPKTITIIEWGKIVSGVLPVDRLSIEILATSENTRKLNINYGGPISKKIQGEISK